MLARRWLAAGKRDARDGGGWFIPFPLTAAGIGTDPERVLAELRRLRGVTGDGTAELELILGGGQSLAGSSRLEGCVVPRCPRASRASAGGPLV